MTDNESCDGCVMIKNGGWCSLIDVGKNKDCPCRICLVKVMCIKPCKEYDIYVGRKRGNKCMKDVKGVEMKILSVQNNI